MQIGEKRRKKSLTKHKKEPVNDGLVWNTNLLPVKDPAEEAGHKAGQF